MSDTPRTDAVVSNQNPFLPLKGHAELQNLARTLERELAASGTYADGFRAARKLASDIVGAYTDGDCPFDSTIAVMVDKIDRLMPPERRNEHC